jgi:hypothetical protein
MLYVAAQAVVILSISPGSLRPTEEHRLLALVLPRITERTSSEPACGMRAATAGNLTPPLSIYALD